MSDRMNASIDIGGILDTTKYDSDLIEEFISLCSDLSTDWDGPKCNVTTLNELLSLVNKDGYLTFMQFDTSWGEFPDLEEICHELNLSYNRYTEGKYEYNSELTHWQLELKEPQSYITDTNGRILIRLEDIQQVFNIFKKSFMKEFEIKMTTLIQTPTKLPKFEIK